MQDRPSALEMLKAVERYLDEQVVPRTEGTLRFHARVSANVLRILQRELELEESQLVAEWEGLDELLGAAERPATLAGLREALLKRNEALAERIRSGAADEGDYAARVLAHVRRTVRDKLLVSDPGWLEP